jgi:mannose-6-phosphate isomerase-like protein (cupin superfamily)
MQNLVRAGDMPFREDPCRRVQRLVHASTVGAKAGFALGIVEYTAHEFGEPDLHTDQEVLYVLDGHGLARLGQDEYDLAPGDCLYIPAGMSHSIAKRGSVPIRLVFARSGSHSAKE